MLARVVSKPSKPKKRPTSPQERVFIKSGLRSFRKTYRVGEVGFGLGTGGVLLGIASWVGWKGANPDPELFDMSAALLAGPEDKGAAAEPAVDRGPLPLGIGGPDFSEGKIGQYSAENLYVKINGRAGFFKSFGVTSMHSVTLEGQGPPGLAPSIDIELYDLGEARNAIGAYNGERAPSVTPQSKAGSTYHIDRNAAFLTRGQYYVRFIGSEESPAIAAELQRLIDLCSDKLSGGKLPWAFALFVEKLGVEPSRVTYVRSNAFSFGFAKDVYKAILSPVDSVDDVEAFVVAKADASQAAELVTQFEQGFGSLGKAAGATDEGVKLFEDEYLGTYSGVAAVEHWVVGLRGAADKTEVGRVIVKLRGALESMTPQQRAEAVPSPADSEDTDDGH